MEGSRIRVLVVDGFEPWRQFICSTIDDDEQLEVIGEVSDGLMAVRQAIELKPDLILIDIALPKMNGIDVARQVIRRVPQSKILFVTQESSEDFVHRVLATGAKGYVVKMHAGNELLTAIRAVLRGEIFVGTLGSK